MTGGECVPGLARGTSCKLRQHNQEGTTGKVGLGLGLLEQPSQQGEQYVQRPGGGTDLASSGNIKEASMAGVTQGDCSANVRGDGGRRHYRVLLAHVRWEPQEDFELRGHILKVYPRLPSRQWPIEDKVRDREPCEEASTGHRVRDGGQRQAGHGGAGEWSCNHLEGGANI